MTLYVNDRDRELEKLILRKSQAMFAPLNVDLKPTDIKDSYDFSWGIKVDVKVRDCLAGDFPNYFVSEEKINTARQEPNFRHYIIYVFNGTLRVVRIYNLDQSLEKRDIIFEHKRAGETKESTVYLVPAKSFEFEFYTDL